MSQCHSHTVASAAMALVPLINWTTGETVGHWVQEAFSENGCRCDWTPVTINLELQEPVVACKVQNHSCGYKWICLPGGGRTLFHRQWYQDHAAQQLIPRDQVHHINGCKSDNRSTNLQLVRSRVHRRHHARERRNPAVLGRRFRGVRRG